MSSCPDREAIAAGADVDDYFKQGYEDVGAGGMEVAIRRALLNDVRDVVSVGVFDTPTVACGSASGHSRMGYAWGSGWYGQAWARSVCSTMISG
jgi:hypothetical protein